MAVNNFIPAVWSARILEGLRKNHVFGQAGVVSRDYEGDIRDAGDRVHIHGLGPVAVADYVKNTTNITYEILTDSRQTLLIDQSKYFAFQVDDVDQAQTKPKVIDAATSEATYNLSNVADLFLAGKYAEAALVQPATGSVALTATNVYGQLIRAARTLDENNVPEEGRFAIVPPWVAELLLDNDRFLSASSQSILNGQIGQVAGLQILKSNNVLSTGTTTVVHQLVVGHSSAIAFAEQIAKVEALRLETRFSDGVRGLHLYGGKVVRPNALLNLKATV